VENVIYPCSVIELMTPGEEGYLKKIGDEPRAVDEEAVFAPALDRTLSSMFR
jgi:hypothetical protein